jgi:hypothetical protein
VKAGARGARRLREPGGSDDVDGDLHCAVRAVVTPPGAVHDVELVPLEQVAVDQRPGAAGQDVGGVVGDEHGEDVVAAVEVDLRDVVVHPRVLSAPGDRSAEHVDRVVSLLASAADLGHDGRDDLLARRPLDVPRDGGRRGWCLGFCRCFGCYLRSHLLPSLCEPKRASNCNTVTDMPVMSSSVVLL